MREGSLPTSHIRTCVRSLATSRKASCRSTSQGRRFPTIGLEKLSFERSSCNHLADITSNSSSSGEFPQHQTFLNPHSSLVTRASKARMTPQSKLVSILSGSAGRCIKSTSRDVQNTILNARALQQRKYLRRFSETSPASGIFFIKIYYQMRSATENFI